MLGVETGAGFVRPEKLRLGILLKEQALFIVGGRPEKNVYSKNWK